MYAIGTAQADGRPVLWVQGMSVWFEIEPSVEYTRMYTHMMRGLGLFYHIVTVYDRYEAWRKKSKQVKYPGLDDVLFEVRMTFNLAEHKSGWRKEIYIRDRIGALMTIIHCPVCPGPV